MRRDPKNLNNKMSLEQLQKLAPSFDWKAYLAAVHSPMSPHYLVTSPGFFKGLEEVEKFWRADRVYEPAMKVDRREELFGGWKRAVARCRYRG